MNKTIKLSPSSLNLFRECPHCFWMDRHGKAAPAGMPMALHCTLDAIEKAYYDKHRSAGLPPMLKGKIPVKLVSQDMAERVRSYLHWTDEETSAVLRGKMDDCFVDKDGTIVVMDNKTSAGRVQEVYDSYAFQLDCYAFLLEKNGHKVSKTGYIVFFVPDKNSDIEHGVKFNAVAHEVALNPGRVLKVFRDAVKLVQKDKPPKHEDECEMCCWVKMMREE